VKSADTNVTFTVLEAVPSISSITPDNGHADASTVATIYGRRLSGASLVSFNQSGISATVNSSSETKIEITIRIATDAPLGDWPFEVTTPRGIVRSADTNVTFTVLEALPTISSITPDNGYTDTRTSATIYGRHLFGATLVSFNKSGISGTVNSSSETAIKIAIRIDNDAPLGDWPFEVTTPRGTAKSADTDVTFTVLAAVPSIRSIAPDNGQTGTNTSATIYGQNLTGASRVSFNQPGISATIRSVSKTAIKIAIRIKTTAPLGNQSFEITTPRRIVKSADFKVYYRVWSVYAYAGASNMGIGGDLL
jgi:preprotein translocase subunit YajC